MGRRSDMPYLALSISGDRPRIGVRNQRPRSSRLDASLPPPGDIRYVGVAQRRISIRHDSSARFDSGSARTIRISLRAKPSDPCRSFVGRRPVGPVADGVTIDVNCNHV